MLIVSSIHNNKVKKIFFTIFYIGLFLLPSAFSISLIFLLLALGYGLYSQRKVLLEDKYNLILIFVSILMCLSAFKNTSVVFGNPLPDWDKSLAWISLLNWIPLFLCFSGFQVYLEGKEERKRFAQILLAGSFPVLASGIAQSFFSIFGPFKTLGGLIVWYQRPINDFTELSALFSNRNYAGCWFNIIWPFSLASLICNKNKFNITAITLPLSIVIVISLILTTSRSAWLGLVLSVPLVLGVGSLTWFLPIILFIFLIILGCIYPIFGIYIQEIIRQIIPKNIWEEFTPLEYASQSITRLDIWSKASKYIIENPLFGHGSGTFPYLLEDSKNIFVHPHNLPFEIALSFGLPVMLLIISTVFILTFLSFKYIYIKNKINNYYLFERAWITSLIILMLGHLVDIQYFDGRISIISWILIAGMSCIIREGKSPS